MQQTEMAGMAWRRGAPTGALESAVDWLEDAGVQVWSGWAARLEDAQRRGGVGDRDAFELHDHVRLGSLEAGRARVVPDGLLSGTGLDASHEVVVHVGKACVAKHTLLDIQGDVLTFGRQ